MKPYISEMLDAYLQRPLSPWHMPGHKRKPILGGMWDNLFARDVTEVPGTDDYHHPEGAILLSQQEAASVYGSAFSHYLVGGSTSGILAGILALADLYREEHDVPPIFLVAKNVHRSVHNALRLAGAECIELTPSGDPDYGPVLSEEIERGINAARRSFGLRPQDDTHSACHSERSEESPESELRGMIAGCILTSPTYSGAISPLREIRMILHKAGIPLLVDEAHGAHFPFIPELKEASGIACGAELVVQSLHKTLPALTQTAILHVNGEGGQVNRLNAAVKKRLAVVQSSSPSYILLASAEKAVAWASEAEQDFEEYMKRLHAFRRKLTDSLVNIELVAYPVLQDPTRITLRFRADPDTAPGATNDTASAPHCSMTRAAAWLEEQYGIVAELAGIRELILISTAVDTEADLNRLYQALLALDQNLSPIAQGISPSSAQEEYRTSPECTDAGVLPPLPQAGETAAEDIYVYPPGTFLVKKGEIISEKALRRIREELRAGRKVHGLDAL